MIKDLINAIAEGNTLAIEDNFNAVMANKISDRLDSMRVDVAQGMFGSVDESYDSSDAYETWDPKHPKFKDKLIKHHAKGGTTQSFIDQEKAKAKKKLTRESYDLEDYSVEELEDFMMSEEFEQLDEVSKKTLGSYVTKAHDQLMKHTAAVNFKSGRGDSDVLSYTHEPTTARKTANRTKGVATAIGKLTKESFDIEDYSVEELEDFMMSEEFEQLDELSKKTLGSYINKAHSDTGKQYTHEVKFKEHGDHLSTHKVNANNDEHAIHVAAKEADKQHGTTLSKHAKKGIDTTYHGGDEDGEGATEVHHLGSTSGLSRDRSLTAHVKKLTPSKKTSAEKKSGRTAGIKKAVSKLTK